MCLANYVASEVIKYLYHNMCLANYGASEAFICGENPRIL
jgi:hypothetical protein